MLGACGHGSSTIPPAATAPTSVASAAPAAGARGTARFVIKIPPQPAAAQRKPAYISPATQSITIVLSGPTPTNVTSNLTPTTSGCSSTLASTSCALTIALMPGAYTGSITTYDGANGTGNLLSANQTVAFTIVSGQSNTVSLTLNGVPHQILISSLTNAATLSGSTYTLAGPIAASFEVAALDIDGDIIFGAGAPTFTISQTSGSAMTVVGPTTAKPNGFTLMPPAGNAASAAFTITATFGDATCTQTGAVCTTTLATLTHQQTMIVDEGNAVAVLPWPYTGTPTYLSGINYAPGYAYDAAFDASGNLYFVDFGAADVKVYAPPYTGAPTMTLGDGTLYYPEAVAIGPNGTVFVSDAHAIFEFALPYTTAPTAHISSGQSEAVAMLFDAAGNLYAANYGNNTVTRYAPPYTQAPTVLGTGIYEVSVLGVTPGGIAFASATPSYYEAQFSEFVPPYTSPTTITADANEVTAFAIGPDGSTLFVGQSGYSRIDQYAPPYTSVLAQTPGQTAQSPVSLSFDAAANLYSANQNQHSIQIFAPPYTAQPETTISLGVGVNAMYLSP
jgi:hypothetical protein